MKNKIVLDIGCGYNKFSPDAIGVDIHFTPVVDIICDLEKGLPFRSNSIDYIYCSHVLEHINNFEELLEEIYRIVKKNGKIHIVVPHFSNTLAYSDYTHKRFFGYFTFDYFSTKENKYWKVFHYNKNIKFIFNRNETFSYFYESKLSWTIPCFEIEFILEPVKV